PEQVEDEFDFVIQTGLGPAENPLNRDAACEIGDGERSLLRIDLAQGAFLDAFLKDAFDDPCLLEVQLFALRQRLFDAAKLRLINMEEVAVFVEEGDLRREQAPQPA